MSLAVRRNASSAAASAQPGRTRAALRSSTSARNAETAASSAACFPASCAYKGVALEKIVELTSCNKRNPHHLSVTSTQPLCHLASNSFNF